MAICRPKLVGPIICHHSDCRPEDGRVCTPSPHYARDAVTQTRRLRQGWSAPAVSPGQGHKAHSEPLPSLDDRTDPQAFHHSPPEGLASLSTINAATMRLCRADLPASPHPSRLKAAPTAFILTERAARRKGRPYPRSQRVVRAECWLEQRHSMAFLHIIFTPLPPYAGST